MFRVREDKLGPLGIIKLVNEKTGEYISILPEMGARLNELVLSKNGIKHQLLDGCETYEALLEDQKENKFKGSNLFPFPNRINHGRYSHNGNDYQLKKNFPGEDNAIHGLILSSIFRVKGKSENQKEVNLLLEYKFNGAHSGYPFSSILELRYTLSDSGMQCCTKVTNDSDTSIPFGHGWHPYFKTGSLLNDIYLKIPSNQILETDERLIPSGKMILSDKFLEPTQVKDHAFDTCYKITNTERGMSETELYDRGKDLNIVCWQESGPDKYRFVQIYIPPNRRSIAIEPCTCAPDAFNNQKGLLILQPGESREFSYGVKLK
jgi:aldose 1-epimerase